MEEAKVSIAFRRCSHSGLHRGSRRSEGAEQSPLPFGSVPTRDMGVACEPLPQRGHVSIAFRRGSHSGQGAKGVELRDAVSVSIAFRRGSHSGRNRNILTPEARARGLQCLSARFPLGTQS